MDAFDDAIQRLQLERFLSTSAKLILVAKSKMPLILSLNSLGLKRENRLRHQYQSCGRTKLWY